MSSHPQSCSHLLFSRSLLSLPLIGTVSFSSFLCPGMPTTVCLCHLTEPGHEHLSVARHHCGFYSKCPTPGQRVRSLLNRTECWSHAASRKNILLQEARCPFPSLSHTDQPPEEPQVQSFQRWEPHSLSLRKRQPPVLKEYREKGRHYFYLLKGKRNTQSPTPLRRLVESHWKETLVSTVGLALALHPYIAATAA